MLYAVVLAILVGLIAAEFDPELHAKYLTMPKLSFIEYFNAQGYSWKMAEYDHVHEKYAAGALIDKESFNKLPVKTHDLKVTPPKNLDLRDGTFCKSLKQIYNQGNCSSCWAFATATVASDRICSFIFAQISLSEQDFECMQKDVCKGGNPQQAFDFWRDEGLVTQKCKPYNVSKLLENKCETECDVSHIDYKGDKHFSIDTYTVPNKTENIKLELFTNGPIQATFAVYQDFIKYKSGIYEHSFGKPLGYRSVRVIGYGVENGTHYWLVANSWGSEWGEFGWIRIKAYQPELEFENYLLAGTPKRK